MTSSTLLIHDIINSLNAWLHHPHHFTHSCCHQRAHVLASVYGFVSLVVSWITQSYGWIFREIFGRSRRCTEKQITDILEWSATVCTEQTLNQCALQPVLPVARFFHPIGRFFRLIWRAIFGGRGLRFFWAVSELAAGIGLPRFWAGTNGQLVQPMTW